MNRLAIALALAAALGARPAAAAGSAEHGRVMAQRLCSACHAIGSHGESPNHKAPPFRTLGTKYPIDMLQEALAEGIRTGHPAMPAFAFEPPQIDDLIAYIKSVQPPRPLKIAYP